MLKGFALSKPIRTLSLNNPGTFSCPIAGILATHLSLQPPSLRSSPPPSNSGAGIFFLAPPPLILRNLGSNEQHRLTPASLDYMATLASLHPASPPAISGVVAVAACAAMAVSYVAVLYAPMVILRFPPPTSLRTFLHRRFACAAVASAASALATVSLLRVWSLSDFADMFAVFGVRKDHLIQAVAIPLLLTSLVYAGSFVTRLWLLESSWGSGDEVEIGCAQRLAQWIQAAVADVMVWRNYVVAPFTEELVFRACMIPLLLCGGFKMSTIIFLSPVFFSLAHLNHLFELHQQGCNFMRSLLIVGVQLGYTVIFGWYAAFLFIRTGNLLCPIIAHVFCNMMGLPVFSSPRTKGAASVAFLAGSIAFFWLLFPATSPELFNSSFDRCSCWHGFCNWK